MCAMKVTGEHPKGLTAEKVHHRPTMRPCDKRFECEHRCWDPKDGELCMTRVKPGETLVEARSGFNVQINRQSCV